MKKLIVAAVLFFACMFACSSAFAQDSINGFWIRAGLGVPVTINAGGNESVAGAYKAAGFGVNLQLGYRWERISVQLEQDIGGAFVTDSAIADSYELMNKKAQYFLGGTYLMVTEYCRFDNLQLYLGEALGAMYGAKGDFRAFWVDSDSAFAVKIDFGITYFIQGKYGVGFNFDYALAIALEESGASLSHLIQPMLTFSIVL